MTERLGRAWFAVTALAVLAGVVVQLFASAGHEGGHFTGWQAVLNVFAYFTVQSNILLGVTSALLALRTDRVSTLFRALRLDGVVAIAVTGIVYHSVLAGLDFYPSPFVDVEAHGLGRVLLNCLLVAVLFLGLAAGATWLDRALARRPR
ncbi:MAG TPA: hypothetical protein VEK80_15210 [Kribbellaceae bacterium]|nr:hypothetical protein [Kribbellaceae bacterium]